MKGLCYAGQFAIRVIVIYFCVQVNISKYMNIHSNKCLKIHGITPPWWGWYNKDMVFKIDKGKLHL